MLRASGSISAGAVVYGIMLFTLIYGMLLLPDPAGLAWIAAASGLRAVFYRWEKRSTSPLIDLSVFAKNRTFVFSNIAAMINYGATFGVGVLLSLYLQYIQGFSAASAGLILVAQPVVQTIFSPLAGRLSDRIEPRIVATAGMALTTLGLFIVHFPHAVDTRVCHRRKPDGAGSRVRSFLVAEHQRDHEFG